MNLMLFFLLVAVIEEAIKLAITRLFPSYSNRLLWIARLLIFALLESALKFSSIYEHLVRLGETNLLAVKAILVCVGTASFHITSSLYYLKSKRLFLPYASMVLVHWSYNVVVSYLPPFPVPTYYLIPLLIGASFSFPIVLLIFCQLNYLKTTPISKL